MASCSRLIIMGVVLMCVCALPEALPAAEDDATTGLVFAKAAENKPGELEGAPSLPESLKAVKPDRINAVIYPYRAATVGTEVRGIVDRVNVKEGQPVKEGDVVAEVSKERYEAIVGEFRGNYEAVTRTLERAKEELALQESLYERRACTFDDLAKARSQVRILESRKAEAIHKLKQAELNLRACVLKAPFDGNITVLYHEPAEPVDNLEKVFGVIDTHRVYARANWQEADLSRLKLGGKAVFHYEGNTYDGTIDKIASLIDPASKSKRVHILIENPDGRLQVGMSGGVNLAEGDKEDKKVSAR